MPDSEIPHVDTGLVHAHGLAALRTLMISLAFGILAAVQLLVPDLGAHFPWLTWGRIRYDHTQGILFGWLGNAFLAFLYHAVPRLTSRPVTSVRLGHWIFGIWNFAIVLPGWLLVLAGFSQPLEWAEFPLVIDAFVILALALAMVQFLPAFFRRGIETLYVSSWYIIGALVFTILAYPMGNFVPELVPGARGAAFSGLWIHDAVGLFVTPLALAIIYFVIPAATGRPIFSHFLSMLGFWLLFFVYPLNGTHHYVFSVIPMNAQTGAIAASTLLGVDVLVVVANLLLSLRGSGWVARDPALRFVALSTVFYLIVSIQGSLQAQMSINRAVHFSDWVIGHSHLAMLGFATFAAAGGLVHAWQRIPGVRYNPRAIEWAFWMLTAGVVIMAADLTLAGIVQARLWQSSAPWLDSVRAAKPYWLVRALSAIPIVAGFGALLDGLTTGPRNALRPIAAAQVEARAGTRGLRMAYLSASVAGIAFFALSIVLLAIWPGKVLEQQTRAMSPDHPLTLSVSEERGRLIYAREGCAYCHTQQIRFLQDDMKRFGAPTLAWETRYDYPHLWGTRRIGPDLAREGGARSEDWQLAHLYAPRTVVRDSVMPAYRALFDGSPERPRQEARDLAAYLETLGRARELAGPEGEARAREICLRAGDEMALLAFQSSGLNASPARSRRSGGVPPLGAADLMRGRTLYQRNCASCHGARGMGDGPGANFLHPPPENLAAHRYSANGVARILWNGAPGTAMPAWRDLAPADLASLAAAVRELYIAAPETPANLELGAKVYTANCAQCHGTEGAGDGPAVSELHVLPHDFRDTRPTLAEALRAVREGVEGTRMAPWSTRLSDNDLAAVAAYVRTFFQEAR